MVLYDREKLPILRDQKLFCRFMHHRKEHLDIAYECMLRYEKWDRIVLMRMGHGALFVSLAQQ